MRLNLTAVNLGDQFPLAVNYRNGSEPFKRKPLTALRKETAHPSDSLKCLISPSSLFHLIRRCIVGDHVSHSTSWGLSYPLAKALTIRSYIKTLFLSCYRSGLTSRAPCLAPMEAWLLMLLIFQSISVQCKKLCNIRFEQLFFLQQLTIVVSKVKSCFLLNYCRFAR